MSNDIDAVVVLSGGQDSALCLCLASEKYSPGRVAAITFSYGQRHSSELAAAKTIAASFGISRHKTVDLDFLPEITSSALLDPSKEISASGAGSPPNTVVEGRNAFFLLAAGVWAKSLGAHEIWTGVSQTDFSGYPDCRRDFIVAQEKSMSLAMDWEFRIVTPFMGMSKADEWDLAKSKGVYDMIDTATVTCYEGIPGDGCGKCPACILRKNGKEESLRREIRSLAAKRNAVILAHNYQRPEVQEIADFTGDSLELARKAAETDNPVIVFCGVYFMAETAAILNPGKTILIPDETAGCPMADMVTAEDLRALKAEHPDALAVCYVNSTAEVKAECDICVTSGNAERVMAALPADREKIFVPDMHLGGHIAALRGEKYILWRGWCPTHARITPQSIERARAAHPGAPVLVHPECAKDVRAIADECLSTGGMCAYARKSGASDIIVATETGILHRLRKENPEKTFHPVDEEAVCPNMKKTTLEKLRDCLGGMSPRVTVPDGISRRARRAIDAMLAVK